MFNSQPKQSEQQSFEEYRKRAQEQLNAIREAIERSNKTSIHFGASVNKQNEVYQQ